MAEMVPSEIASDIPCARCGGHLQVRYCAFDLDLPVVALCVVCLYGPDGILTGCPCACHRAVQPGLVPCPECKHSSRYERPEEV